MIISDTREQKNQHILNYFERNGIEYKIQKVHKGDYFNPDNPTVIIERKADLAELRTNLFSEKNSDGTKSYRFEKEIKELFETGMKIIVLCEHGRGIKTLNDVPKWDGKINGKKYSRVSSKKLAEELFRLHIAYGVEFLFCDKRSTGRRIVEILGGGNE